MKTAPHPRVRKITVPLPPIDICGRCPSPLNCNAYRQCMLRLERQNGPAFRRLTAGDLVERTIGWACLGFAAGWLAGWQATEWFLRQP